MIGNPKNCWEFKLCSEAKKKSCQVYLLKMGDECWNIADVKDARPPAKREDCFNCGWYKMKNH